jgi:hypothetical protein
MLEKLLSILRGDVGCLGGFEKILLCIALKQSVTNHKKGMH